MGTPKPRSGHTLRDIGRELSQPKLTPAQEQMRQDFVDRAEARRQEMLRHGHRTNAEIEAELRAARRVPITAGAAIDELIGNTILAHDAEAKEVQSVAHEIINEAGTGLQLSMQQWAIVQRMIELGIIAGRAGS